MLQSPRDAHYNIGHQRGLPAAITCEMWTMDATITVTVNGKTSQIATDPRRSILDALREELRETGSIHRCGQGRCGGCVVLLDGKRILSCDTPIIMAHQRTITTIES